MTDLSLELRRDLARDFELGTLEVVSRQDSRVDGSSKYLFRLRDGGAVEAVFMPTEKRVTLCISSQMGCTLDCIFCQTGRMGFHRNLEAHEIVEQLVPLWRRVRGTRTRTNIVFMGMGEPLHNVPEVVAACRLVSDPLGLNLGPKRAAKTDLAELVRAARDYAERFRERVTIEYVLMHGVNDAPEDADRLAALLGGGPFKINLIPYNPGASEDLVRPSREQVDRFAQRLFPRSPAASPESSCRATGAWG